MTNRVLPRARQFEKDCEQGGELPAGTIVGEHVIRGLLARGGHGAVYEAEHRMLGRRDAIKVLHQHLTGNGEMLQRFVREARVVNQIRHPNVVDVYDYGILADGSPYFVMELLEGLNMSAMLRARGRVSPARALAYLEPVCAALEAAHRAGVIHRDLKGSNIIVVEDKDPPRVKLLDFGVAKLLTADPSQPGLTAVGERLGTPHAMAPEQIRGATIDQRTDIYALGVLLYHLLTARYPFESSDGLEVEWLHLSAPPPRPSLRAPVSAALDAVVLRCLEKEPERRYPDIASFLDALREAAAPDGGGDGQQATAAVKALAVHVELEIDEGAQEDHAVLDQVAEILDGAERGLQAAGFILSLQAGTSLLGIRVLPDDVARAGCERQAAIALAQSLCQRVDARQSEPRVRAYLCVHVDRAEVRWTASGLELVGGPVAKVSEWVRRDSGRLTLTSSALLGT